MSETQLNTGYGALDNNADVDTIFERRIAPAGTKVTVAVLPAEATLTPGKEVVKARFEIVAPDNLEGIKFEEMLWMGNVPRDPERPYATSFHVSRATATRVVAGVLQKPVEADGVRDYFSTIPRPDNSLESVALALVEGLNAFTGRTFETVIGVRVDIDQLTKQPKLNPNTGEPYPPKQTLGRIAYPRQRAAKTNGAAAA